MNQAAQSRGLPPTQVFGHLLSGLQDDKRQALLHGLADELLAATDRCWQQHLMRDGSAQLWLTPASDQECLAVGRVWARAFEAISVDRGGGIRG